MRNTGAQCKTLKASTELRNSLESAGNHKRYASNEILFREDDGNAGVFFLLKGKVLMSVKNLPKLDRLFSTGSVLGLPSTFTGHPYSLTALAVTEAEIVQVPQEAFLQLMRERPDLCGEAAEMLGREVNFIHSALAERRKRSVARKLACETAVS